MDFEEEEHFEEKKEKRTTEEIVQDILAENIKRLHQMKTHAEISKEEIEALKEKYNERHSHK